MSSNLLGSGLWGWLVLCWFIADRAWHVSLETQRATDINWGTVSVYQTASKIVACWSEQQLTTVLITKLLWAAIWLATRANKLSSYWAFDLSIIERPDTACNWGRGSAILVLTRLGLRAPLSHNGRTTAIYTRAQRLDASDQVASYWPQCPRAKETTPASDRRHAPLPCCFAVYADDWPPQCCPISCLRIGQIHMLASYWSLASPCHEYIRAGARPLLFETW